MAIRDSRVVLTQMGEAHSDEQTSRDAAIEEFFSQLIGEMGVDDPEAFGTGKRSSEFLVIYDKFAGWTR